MTILLALLQNVGLLCLGAVALFLFVRRVGLPAEDLRRQGFFGVVLGAISVVVVGVPIEGPLGASFDTRAGPVVLAGYFAGPLGGLVAAAIGGVARYQVGGPATIGGVLSFFLYAGAGIAFAWVARSQERGHQGIAGFAVLAAVATVLVLPSFFIGQSIETGLLILAKFWPVLVIGNVLSVVLLGLVIEALMELVTQRNQYALALKTSSLARAAARIGVWTYDVRDDRHLYDDIQHALMGTSPGTFDPSNAAFLGRVVPEDRPRIEAALKRSMSRCERFADSFRIQTDEGVRHLRMHVDVVGGTAGQPDRMVGVSVDRTREAELLAELQLRGTALDNAVCGVVVAEARDDHPIVYVNRAFTEITGYTPTEVLGRNCRLLNQGLGYQPELDYIRDALEAQENCTVTLKNRRKDGGEFWNNLQISTIKDADGRVTHFIGIQEDVSEQVLARNVIANSRDQMRAILNAAPDAILTVDPNQKIVSFNPAATDLFGWTQEEIIGQSIQALIPQELRRRHFDQVARYVGDPSAKTGPMSAARIVYAQRKDGTTFPALISLATYRVNGRDMVTATAHDMSETVRVNQELTLLSDQLRRQLEDANEANEAKTRFLAHMSHELRTPLNAIIGFADMLSTFGVEKLGAERSNDYVSDIKSSGEHLLSLINDILDLSKIEAGETEIWIQDVACGDIIDAAVAGMHPVFQNYGVSVEIDRAVVPTVACDRRLTYQSLLNLMSNAAKFSPPNGTVTVRMRPERGGVRIDVIDRGPGISAELQNRIGEPFLRNDDPWTAQTEGSGLGLAITKSIVERQSGRFEIRSGPEGGTTASVWLPSSTSDAVVEDHAETPQRRFG